MREIKFRAWSYGMRYLAKPEDFRYFFGGMDGPERTLTECELMQYTGLKDKNGKDIYDGDICEFDILGSGDKHKCQKSMLHIVEWKNGAWGVRPLFPELVHEDDREWFPFVRSDYMGIWDTNYFEVIGNIHENPELIS